jgi:hypothetical protein
METWKHGDIKEKTEMEAQATFLNLFTVAHREYVGLSFVYLLMKTQMKLSVCKWTLNGLAHLWF